MFAVFIVLHDPSIGKFDLSILPHQNLMEFFIAPLADAERICGYINTDSPSNFIYLNIDTWNGVVCNSADKVIKIEWIRVLKKGGPIAVQYLPESVTVFTAIDDHLEGTLDVKHLPNSLEVLNLSRNLLSGTLALECLPRIIRDVFLFDNNFEGTIDFAVLPGSLEKLNLRSNALTGTIRLTALPRRVKLLNLSMNQFHGDFDCSNLPQQMEILHAFENTFSGSLHLTDLPDTMKEVDLRQNRFTGNVTVAAKRPFINLTGNNVQVRDTFGRVDGTSLRMSARR
uniref:Leucine-rich repeat protein n=1 Tax=Paramoeba aestuarina TaxID=180227 RepID=A0A7S4PKJ8_9EUKA|mmetsp:Transcript_7960/g.12040  ORF Transcript_7960/g.12040 Transcript_7960/m.12040 type:complete len:284 (+) Transcript_7960:30-881(+)